MNTPVQDRVRDALARQAERTEIDPNATFRGPGVIALNRAERSHQRLLKPILAAAAVVVAVIGAAAVVRRTDSSPTNSTALPPVSLVANPPVMVGLPFEVSPASLPVGWEYADLYETPAPSVTPSTESWFLFRNPVTGASISINASGVEDTSGSFRDLRESFADGGAATFAVDGHFVWMLTAGVDPDQAVRIAETLELTSIGGDDVTVAIESSAGFELEWSRLASEFEHASSGDGVILLTTPNGTAQIDLDGSDPTNQAWNHLGEPTLVGDTTVYTSDALGVTGDPIGGRVVATISVTSPADLPAAAEVFASLQVVGAESEVMTWDEIGDRIAARFGRLEVTERIEVVDLVVTEHSGSELSAVCATWHSITRCRSSLSTLFGPPGSVDLVVDGLWVVAGTVEADDPIARPSQRPDPRLTTGAWLPTDTGATFVYAIPSAMSADLEYSGVGVSGEMRFHRPIR